MIKYTTAILLFSRTAQAEAHAKPLAKGRKAAQQMAAFMVNNAYKTALATQFPVFFYTEKQQIGNTFGERLANALEDVFSKGFDNIITIGNDCLFTTQHDILTAAQSLNNFSPDEFNSVSAVLGQTVNNNGAYLIGISQKAFKKELFQTIKWQSEETFSDLLAYFEEQNITTQILESKHEVNTLSDWNFVLKKVLRPFKKQLIAIFNTGFFCPNFLRLSFSYDFNLQSSIGLRAPPF